MINLDELSKRHTITQGNRIKIFKDILKSCHNKIYKYNNEFKNQECLFEPPVFIIGKPPYNYSELIEFLLNSLKKNGLKAEWLPNRKSIYVSWKETDIDIEQYRKQFVNTSYTPINSEDNEIQPFSILTVKSNNSQNSKKKEQQQPQHVAMLEYKPGVKDFVPINIKALRHN